MHPMDADPQNGTPLEVSRQPPAALAAVPLTFDIKTTAAAAAVCAGTETPLTSDPHPHRCETLLTLGLPLALARFVCTLEMPSSGHRYTIIRRVHSKKNNGFKNVRNKREILGKGYSF